MSDPFQEDYVIGVQFKIYPDFIFKKALKKDSFLLNVGSVKETFMKKVSPTVYCGCDIASKQVILEQIIPFV